MSGDSVSSTEFMPTLSDVNWDIAATGDYNSDGITDIVWRHKTSGQNVIWLINGVYVTDMVTLPTLSDLNWEIAAPK
ncbi:MAG: hypothetical protein HQL00_01240 [Nitrospirae bacterium]|nr:hypothetical protein [Nitrospirota bacterium]